MTNDEIAAARRLAKLAKRGVPIQLVARSEKSTHDLGDIIGALCDDVEGLGNALRLIASGKSDTVDRMIARDALRMKRDEP